MEDNFEFSVDEVLSAYRGILSVVSEMHGGMMNRSFIMEDRFKNKYVLYIPTGQSNSMVCRDIEHKAVLKYMDLGITAKNYVFQEETGIKVNEFIPGQSLEKVEDIDYSEVARIIKSERKSSLMDEYYNPFPRLIGYEKERLNLGLKDIREEYPLLRNIVFDNREIMEKGKICLSHNDFQPSNLIRRTDGKYFVIDFEFAMNNYEMYDIACFGNNDVSMGIKLLEAVYNKPKVKDYEAYYLWRMFLSLQWYNVAIIKDYHGEGEAHKIDFLGVANYFIDNALDAYNRLLKLKN